MMPYDPNFPPDLKMPSDNGPSQWSYASSADNTAAMNAPAYISNAKLIGMKIGDAILLFDKTNIVTSWSYVQSFTGYAANLTGMYAPIPGADRWVTGTGEATITGAGEDQVTQ